MKHHFCLIRVFFLNQHSVAAGLRQCLLELSKPVDRVTKLSILLIWEFCSQNWFRISILDQDWLIKFSFLSKISKVLKWGDLLSAYPAELQNTYKWNSITSVEKTVYIWFENRYLRCLSMSKLHNSLAILAHEIMRAKNCSMLTISFGLSSDKTLACGDTVELRMFGTGKPECALQLIFIFFISKFLFYSPILNNDQNLSTVFLNNTI